MALNPVFAFFRTTPTLASPILRMALAALFTYHGCQKAFGWFGGGGFVSSIEVMSGSSGLGIPTLLASTAIIAEVAVVPLLVFGLFTRLAAFVGGCIAAGAILWSPEGAGFAEIQLPLAVLAMALSLMLTGGGYFCLDRRLSRHFLPEVGPYSY